MSVYLRTYNVTHKANCLIIEYSFLNCSRTPKIPNEIIPNTERLQMHDRIRSVLQASKLHVLSSPGFLLPFPTYVYQPTAIFHYHYLRLPVCVSVRGHVCCMCVCWQHYLPCIHGVVSTPFDIVLSSPSGSTTGPHCSQQHGQDVRT